MILKVMYGEFPVACFWIVLIRSKMCCIRVLWWFGVLRSCVVHDNAGVKELRPINTHEAMFIQWKKRGCKQLGIYNGAMGIVW